MLDSPQPALSPPPTPPKQRKRKPDPFLELANTPVSSPLASPGSPASQGEGDESALKKLVLTPLLFASFVISLFLVDRRNRAYRLAEHPPSRASSWRTYFSPRQWLDPQPYQNPANSTWEAHGSDGDDEPDRGKQWVVGKKHRNVARLEFSEAFEMRGKIMVALGVGWTLGILALLWSAKRLVQVVW